MPNALYASRAPVASAMLPWFSPRPQIAGAPRRTGCRAVVILAYASSGLFMIDTRDQERRATVVDPVRSVALLTRAIGPRVGCKAASAAEVPASTAITNIGYAASSSTPSARLSRPLRAANATFLRP